MATNDEQDALIDAAQRRADMYADDNRPNIAADVMNAFFAGHGYALIRARTAADAPGTFDRDPASVPGTFDGPSTAAPAAAPADGLVERLRAISQSPLAGDDDIERDTLLAADALAQQQARIAELERERDDAQDGLLKQDGALWLVSCRATRAEADAKAARDALAELVAAGDDTVATHEGHDDVAAMLRFGEALAAARTAIGAGEKA